MFLRLQLFCVLVVGAIGSIACDEASTTKMPTPSGEIAMVLEVVSLGIDLRFSWRHGTLKMRCARLPAEGASTHTVEVVLLPDDPQFGAQGYSIHSVDGGLEVHASTELGAAYALYHIAGDLGARYIHPEGDSLHFQ